jgi:hypothetical protein
MVVSLLLAGCGGGLRDGKELRELDAAEARELCKEYEEEVTATCTRKGYSVEVSVGGYDCVLAGGGDAVFSSCEATVEDYRGCMDALFEDPCLKIAGLPQICTWMRDCIPPKEDDSGVP